MGDRLTWRRLTTDFCDKIEKDGWQSKIEKKGQTPTHKQKMKINFELSSLNVFNSVSLIFLCVTRVGF